MSDVKRVKLDSESSSKGEDDDIDPLDAFMSEIEKTLEKPTPPPTKKTSTSERDSNIVDPLDAFMLAVRQDLDSELSRRHESVVLGREDDFVDPSSSRTTTVDDEDKAKERQKSIEYDENDIPVVFDGDKGSSSKFTVAPLSRIDHSGMNYQPFARNFFSESEERASVSSFERRSLRNNLNITVLSNDISSEDITAPISSFQECSFSPSLMAKLVQDGISSPTPIQAQALPLALSGCDIVGLAKTGSGKTLAFLLPSIVHAKHQSDSSPVSPSAHLCGPLVLILAPTADLARQITTIAKKLCRTTLTRNHRGQITPLRCVGIWGGVDKNSQFRELRRGSEIVIATPGRLIDMIKMKACSLFRVTMAIIDEADRMLDMGFEPQVSSVARNIRPDRQMMLFSATSTPSVESLIDELISSNSSSDLVTIDAGVGGKGTINENVKQEIIVMNNATQKWDFTVSHLPSWLSRGNVLIFVSTKAAAEELSSNLNLAGFSSAALHGDKDNNERIRIIHAFSHSVLPLLIATDLAARGLDIPCIKTVLNFDVPRSISHHIHRVGRAGRGSDSDGVAYTLLTESDSRFAGFLVYSLESIGDEISGNLLNLAMKNGKFRSRRQWKKGRGGLGNKGSGSGGIGRGYRNDSRGRGGGRGWNKMSFVKSSTSDSFDP